MSGASKILSGDLGICRTALFFPKCAGDTEEGLPGGEQRENFPEGEVGEQMSAELFIVRFRILSFGEDGGRIMFLSAVL
jgi:hypothetical protein